MENRVLSTTDEVLRAAIELRRQIHAHPELSGQERGTARLIRKALLRPGLKPRYFAGRTAVAASLQNGRGRTVVLRADTDALPIQEMNDLPYKSRHPGVMHACGHDLHTACLTGAADALQRMRDLWGGRVILLFQPSEEVDAGGAADMIREGAFPHHPDAVFGLHVTTDHATGQVGLKEGDDFSGTLTFDVTVKGRGGHGATPEKTVDPIVCASSMIMELQTLISRGTPPFEPAVLTVGLLHAGTRRNVIPDEAVFAGTIRTFSDTLQNRLRERVAEVLKATARSFRARAEVVFQKSYPSGYNDPHLTKRARRAFSGVLGARRVVIRKNPTMYSEDFALYQKKAPGLYVHLGVRPVGKRRMPGIHSARFLPDERAMRTGIALHVAFVLEMLGPRH